MHELGFTLQIVEIACGRAQGARISRITLEIGKLSTVLPDAVRFCFDLCTEGTLAEGATLEVIEVPGRARCRKCGTEMPLDRPFGRCECGNTELDWLSGEELKIREMELINV